MQPAVLSDIQLQGSLHLLQFVPCRLPYWRNFSGALHLSCQRHISAVRDLVSLWKTEEVLAKNLDVSVGFGGRSSFPNWDRQPTSVLWLLPWFSSLYSSIPETWNLSNLIFFSILTSTDPKVISLLLVIVGWLQPMSPSGMSWKIKYTYKRAVPKVRHHSLRWPAPTVTMSFCPPLVAHMSGMLTISPAISRPEPQSVPTMQLCRTCCVWYWQYGFAAESDSMEVFPFPFRHWVCGSRRWRRWLSW